MKKPKVKYVKTVHPSSGGKNTVYQIDQSGKIEQTNKDTVIAYANNTQSAVLIPRRIKRKVQEVFRLLRRYYPGIKKDRWAFKRMSFNSGRRSSSVYE